jgi:hypothetical protein
MYDNPRSLLDQITLVHGPHELLGRYFTLADATGRDWGLRFRLRSDFDALLALNRENRDSWPPLSPAFDPAHSNLRIDSAFWLEGFDDRGETVITEIARLYDFKNTDVVAELRSLRIYYENPEPHLAAGERVELDAPAAQVVRGRTMHGGAIWVRPDWRRNGLTRIISRICAAYALTRWNTAFTWGLVEPRLHAGGLSQAYGPHQVAEGVMLRLPFRGDLPAVLIWMTSEALLADLARTVDNAAMIAGERYPRHETFAPWAAPREA